MASFAAGAGVALAVFAWSLTYLYRGLEPKPGETRRDRVGRTLALVDWVGVMMLVIGTGVGSALLWQGFTGIIARWWP